MSAVGTFVAKRASLVFDRGDSYLPLLPNGEDENGDDGTDDVTVDVWRHQHPTLHDLEKMSEDYAGQEESLLKQLEILEAHFQSRKNHIQSELDSVRQSQSECKAKMDAFNRQPEECQYGVLRGPQSLRWVLSNWFTAVCILVVTVNVICMGLEPRYPEFYPYFMLLERVFLAWYVFELVLKVLLLREAAFVGRVEVVWWNWLEFLIVISGIIDLYFEGRWGQSGDLPKGLPSTVMLRALRLLRIFRILRVFEFVRVFCEMDLTWAESERFETLITVVIVINAIVLGLELDIPWEHWADLENAMLAIYSFELSVKLRQSGCAFFYNEDTWMWNNMDFLIVAGGVLDQWMLPALSFVQEATLGSRTEAGTATTVIRLLRMLRLLRVLRLARLMKNIKPLCRLAQGVLEALQGMQWVMLLTLVLLYAAAIVFTSIVGHGYLFGGDPPEAAVEMFGTVPQSMFVLFKLMNDDQSVVDPIVTTIWGRLMFAAFMVLSNWAMLAILTSVVSDNMIAASMRSERDERESTEKLERDNNNMRLKEFFANVDQDGTGGIDEEEFREVMRDVGLRGEFLDATRMSMEDLEDLFNCFSEQIPGKGRVLSYDIFIKALQDEGKTADMRSIMHVIYYMRLMENRLESRLDSALTLLGVNTEDAPRLPKRPSQEAAPMAQNADKQPDAHQTQTPKPLLCL